MGIYRIIGLRRRTQIGPTTRANTMAAMFEPVELVLVDDRVGSLDLEKLDPGSGEWRLMCTVVREAGPVSVNELTERTRAARVRGITIDNAGEHLPGRVERYPPGP